MSTENTGSDRQEYEFHQFAGMFNLLEGEELDGLVRSIKATDGLRSGEEIVLYEGQILDGRNRYRACLLAGVAPRFREFNGTQIEALDFAWSVNHDRRHLTATQRAAAVLEREAIITTLQAEAEERKNQADKLARDEKGHFQPTAPVGQLVAQVDLPPNLAALGISRSIIAKLETNNIAFADVTQDGADLSDLESLADLSRVEVVEIERCVQDWRAGRAKPAPSAQPAKAKPKRAPRTNDRLAKLAGTNPETIRRVRKLKKEAPEKYEQLKTGSKTLGEIDREQEAIAGVVIKQDEVQRRLRQLAQRIVGLEDGPVSIRARLVAYLRKLDEETGGQQQIDMAEMVFRTLIPELNLTKTWLRINVAASATARAA